MFFSEIGKKKCGHYMRFSSDIGCGINYDTSPLFNANYNALTPKNTF